MDDTLVVRRGWLAAAAGLGLVSLSLRWTANALGTDHQVRVFGIVAAILVWIAIRQRSRAIARLAIAVGAIALLFDLGARAAVQGRLVYAGALLAAVIALGLDKRPRVAAAGAIDGEGA